MPRLFVLLIILLAASCAKKNNPLKDILPIEIKRSWTLEDTRSVPNEEAPAVVQGPSLKRALAAHYKGNGRILVRVFEMGSQTSAFEMIQKWRQTDGLAFYKGPYLVVAEADGVDRASLSGFLHELEREIK